MTATCIWRTRSLPGVGCAMSALPRSCAATRRPASARWRVGGSAGRAAPTAISRKSPRHPRPRPRCCYVDFLNTGPAVAATLRRQAARIGAIRRVSNPEITDLVVAGGEIAGPVGLDSAAGSPVTIAVKAAIIATGGLTRIFRRNSASANMGGDGYALALAAGAELVDMEFVQFFPIGHLAPRLVGMAPIMWDPFRYKLGGKLLNGNGDEFLMPTAATRAPAIRHPAMSPLMRSPAKSPPAADRRMAASTYRLSTCRGTGSKRHSALSSSDWRATGST